MKQVPFNRSALALLILFSSFLLCSCTRQAEKDVNATSLQIIAPRSMLAQKVGAMDVTTEQLAHLVINVTGSGMPPSILVWDSHDSTTAPSGFIIDATKGPNRLVQVLAVYSSGTTGDSKMSFYYGEKTQTFVNDNESVPVSIAAIGSGALVSGRASGRYLTSSTAGPTGNVNIKYYPNATSPGLIIEQSLIADGWFNFMMIDGDATTKFSYELDDGTKLWGQSVNLSDSFFAPSNQVLRVGIPVNDRMNYTSMGHYSWEANEPSIYVYGFFGDSTSIASKYVCRPIASSAFISPTSLTRVTQYVSTAPGDDSTQTGLSGSFLTTGAFPTVAALSSTASPMANYSIKGGPSSATACSGTDYITKISLPNLYSMIDGNGSDGAMFHFLPLKAQTVTFGSYVSQVPLSFTADTPTAGTYRFVGELLPGLETQIDKIHAYKRVVNDDWQMKGNTVRCDDIAAGTIYGATPFVSAAGAFAISTGSFNYDVPLSSANVSTGTTLAFCFEKNGVTIPNMGVIIRKDNLNSFVSTGPGAAAQVKLTAPSAATYNSCIDVKVAMVDANGVETTAGSSRTVSLVSSGTGQFFSADSNCTSGYSISSLSFGSTDKAKYIQFKSNVSPSSSASINATSSPLTAATTVSLPIVSPSTATTLKFSLGSRMNIPGTCTAVNVKAVDSSGSTITSATGSVALSSSNSSFVFYSNSGCTTTATTASFSVGTANFYVKPTTALTTNLTFGYSSSPTLSVTQPLEVVASGTMTHLVVSSPTNANYLYSNQCAPYAIQAMDDSNSPKPMTGLLSPEVPLGGGALYTDSNCANLLSSPISLSAANTATFYVKTPVITGTSLATKVRASFLDTGSGGLYSELQSATIGALYLRVAQPGVTSFLNLLNNPNEIKMQLVNAISGGTQVQNLSGSPIAATMQLGTNSSQTGDGQLYTDNICSVPVGYQSGISLASNESQTDAAPLYTQSTVSGSTAVSLVTSIYSAPSGYQLAADSDTLIFCPASGGGSGCP